MRIFLSPPVPSGTELDHLQTALESGYLAPAGPQVRAFEETMGEHLGSTHCVALQSGTGALHLALVLAGVKRGDTVLVSDFSFIASANPVTYVGAQPVFIGSQESTWNMDPEILSEAIASLKKQGIRPRACILVHNLGLPAEIEPIRNILNEDRIPLIEDAAEALGSTHKSEVPTGTLADFSIFSFNGNKIITTSGGGLLRTNHPEDAVRARELASQDREPGLDFRHRSAAWNYRMSNLVAAVGLAQLPQLSARVFAKNAIFQRYCDAFSENSSIQPMPEPPSGATSNRWLSAFTFPDESTRNRVSSLLNERKIESRHLWVPIPRQPAFSESMAFGTEVADHLHKTGLALPSGAALTTDEQSEVIETVFTALG